MSSPVYDSYAPPKGALKPYLELPHLLSLTWLAYPILSLLFVAFRLQISLGSAQDAIASAKDNLVASCQAAERAATGAASMPRYMALATNQQYAEAVNASMNAARAALVLSLTIMEGVINFIIDIYRSTFLCFLELVIRGGLAILIAAVQELNDLVKNAASALSSSIQSDISGANSAIQSAIDGINKVNPFSDIQAPQIPVPDLSSLQNVTLPSTIQDTLTKLNSSLPTFQDIKDKIEQVIDTPFELVKKDINDTFANMTFSPDGLPVPDQNLLSFCGDVDTSVVDDLGHDLIKSAKIGIIIIILLALILIGLNCLLEWYKWRCMRRHLEYTRQAWMTDPILYHNKSIDTTTTAAPTITMTDHNLLVLQANSAHPLITRIVNTLTAKLRLSQSKNISLQWFFSYIFHPPALACLLIGLFGLLSVQVQLLALSPLVHKYEDRAAASAADFSGVITRSINNDMQNQSTFYADAVNARVDAMQNSLNDGLFGWVNGTTTTLNDTLNEFYSDIQNAVSTAFNGTFLEQPAQEFIKCLIGTKVDALENALTFLHDNLVINVPRMNQSALMLSQGAVDEATRPVAAAAIGSGDDDGGGIVGKLVQSYAEGLKKERVMFAIFMGLWGVVVLMGICVLVWHAYIKPAVEKRKRRKYAEEQHSNVQGLVTPFRTRTMDAEKDYPSGGGGPLHLPQFTPLPSPKQANGGFNAEDTFAAPAPPYASRPIPENQKSWDSFFAPKDFTTAQDGGREQRKRTISSPKRLMAIGKKALGKERLAGSDGGDRDVFGAPVENRPSANERNTAWFGKFAAMIGNKKGGEVDSDDTRGPRGRPNLTISIDRASSRNSDYVVEGGASNVDRSRWSVSPVNTAQAPAAPWAAKSPTTPTTPKKWLHPVPNSMQFPHPPIGLPIRPSRPRAEANVPKDISASSYEDSLLGGAPGLGAPLAPPLHHGFNNTPPHPSPQSLAPPPLHPSRGLAPPPWDKHRRSTSVPASKFKNAFSHHQRTSSGGLDAPMSPLGVSPSRESTSGGVNPFLTPFDDEHKAVVSPPPVSRRSIPTNPFTPVAI